MKKTEVYKYNRISIIICIIFISLLFTTCGVVVYTIFISISDELYAERSQNLNEVSEQISKTVSTICSYSWDVSDAAFSHILSSEIETTKDLAPLLAEAEGSIHNHRFYLAVVDSQTNYYLANGHTGLFKNVEFLKTSAAPHQVVMTSVTFASDREYMKDGYQEHIFEPFWQENNHARTNYEGTGLGMTIVKKLIDNMGGTIAINSRVNEGSCFNIVLPFSISLNAFAVQDSFEKPLPLSSLKGMTVLLCDDNILNRDIAEHILKKADANVIIACDGEEAVQAFENCAIGSVDVILMVIMMPVMDGLMAAEKIRSLCRADAKSVPIIAMTANAFEEDIQKTLAAGMNEHLSKPINKKLLISTLLKYKTND